MSSDADMLAILAELKDIRNELDRLKGFDVPRPSGDFVRITGDDNKTGSLNVSGNVGIGTIAPKALFHSYEDSLTDPSLTFNAVAGAIIHNYNTELAFGLSSVSPYPYWIQARNTSNAAWNLTLQPLGGNVGIGTDPGSSTQNLLYMRRDQASELSAFLHNANSSGGTSLQVIGDGGAIVLARYGTTHAAYGAIAAGAGYVYESSASMTFMVDNGSGVMKFATGGSAEKMRLDASGNVGIGTTGPTAKFSVAEKCAMNPDGGFMVKLTNKTGGNSVKGEVVMPYDAGAVNNAVAKIVQNEPDPIGVFYESGVADGAEAWIVVAGIADVYFIGNTTRGHIARGFVTADAGYVTGQALSEAVPSSPFATDKHFFEIGHVMESRTGAGLAKCILHFN